jgi:hypothetical protein
MEGYSYCMKCFIERLTSSHCLNIPGTLNECTTCKHWGVFHYHIGNQYEIEKAQKVYAEEKQRLAM